MRLWYGLVRYAIAVATSAAIPVPPVTINLITDKDGGEHQGSDGAYVANPRAKCYPFGLCVIHDCAVRAGSRSPERVEGQETIADHKQWMVKGDSVPLREACDDDGSPGQELQVAQRQEGQIRELIKASLPRLPVGISLVGRVLLGIEPVSKLVNGVQGRIYRIQDCQNNGNPCGDNECNCYLSYL